MSKKNENRADNIDSAVPGIPDFESWESEQVGFAPYWAPAPGKFFVGTPVARDERDPDFVRYMVAAAVDTPCKRGAVENAQDVMVRKGEYFTVSVYFALAPLFDDVLEFSLDTGKTPVVYVKAIEEVKTKKAGQTAWQFEVKGPPGQKAALAAYRAERKRAELEDARERKALEK